MDRCFLSEQQCRVRSREPPPECDLESWQMEELVLSMQEAGGHSTCLRHWMSRIGAGNAVHHTSTLEIKPLDVPGM